MLNASCTLMNEEEPTAAAPSTPASSESPADSFEGMMRGVYVVPSLDEVRRLPESSLVAVHHDGRGEFGQWGAGLGLRCPGPTLIFLSQLGAPQAFAPLFGSLSLTNYLAVHGTPSARADLFATVKKLSYGEIFGLDKYFAPPTQVHSIRVRTTADKDGALASIASFVAGLPIPSRLRALVVLVADEYLTNALYNAPVQADGSRPYADRPRTEPVELEAGPPIEFRFCYDGVRIGISANDPFGSLEPMNVLDCLARGSRAGADQVSEGTGGAGIGLFQILGSLSHFVINLERGRRTEMIGLIDVAGGYRKFLEAGRSFNIFVKREQS